jgi:hypothetical protein
MIWFSTLNTQREELVPWSVVGLRGVEEVRKIIRQEINVVCEIEVGVDGFECVIQPLANWRYGRAEWSRCLIVRVGGEGIVMVLKTGAEVWYADLSPTGSETGFSQVVLI